MHLKRNRIKSLRLVLKVSTMVAVCTDYIGAVCRIVSLVKLNKIRPKIMDSSIQIHVNSQVSFAEDIMVVLKIFKLLFACKIIKQTEICICSVTGNMKIKRLFQVLQSKYAYNHG